MSFKFVCVWMQASKHFFSNIVWNVLMPCKRTYSVNLEASGWSVNVPSGSRWWAAFEDRTLAAWWQHCSHWCCNPPAGTWWPSLPKPASAGWKQRCMTACEASGPAHSSSMRHLPPRPLWWPPPRAADSTSLGYRHGVISKAIRYLCHGRDGMAVLYLWTLNPSAGRWPNHCQSLWGGPGRWGSQKPGWNSPQRYSCPIGPAWGHHKANAAVIESGTHKRWSLGCYRRNLQKKSQKNRSNVLAALSDTKIQDALCVGGMK